MTYSKCIIRTPMYVTILHSKVIFISCDTRDMKLCKHPAHTNALWVTLYDQKEKVVGMKMRRLGHV